VLVGLTTRRQLERRHFIIIIVFIVNVLHPTLTYYL
jgi:hypothetical protein